MIDDTHGLGLGAGSSQTFKWNERKVNQTPVDRWTTEKRRPGKTLSVPAPSVFLVETTQLVNEGNDFTR